MKKFSEDMTNEEIVAAAIAERDKERVRREAVYGVELANAPHLLDLLPLFRLTHTARAQRCLDCERRIPPFELHYLCGGGFGGRVCQDDTCTRSRQKPALRLASLDGQLL